MKRMLIFILLLPTFCYGMQIKKVVFFKNTQFPLVVYFIKGDKPGPTIMVQGGIQGDEICGVLTAQSLLHAKLKKGNLIVVPRADLPSILLRKRGINVDLNRRFDRNYRKFYEDHLAEAIKFLASLSKGLVHLHEGSGFYSPVFISELRNPKRYGQSFIIDTKKYNGKLLLEDTVKPVMKRVNSKILNKKYWFKIFNTNTLSPSTLYPEQRRSFSYFMLTKLGHPAFAIEVSKDIKDIKWKTSKQLHATQLVLKKLGVEVEVPDGPTYMPPKQIPEGVRVFLDGEDITHKKDIILHPFSRIWVTHPSWPPDKDMEFGVFSTDRPCINFLQTMYLFPIKDIKALFLSIDGKRVKTWRVNAPLNYSSKVSEQRPVFVCELNKKIILVPNKSTIIATQGDRLILWGILNGTGREVINLKGYISKSGPNTGQDMGTEILLDKDFFMSSYITPIKGSNGWMCEVVQEDGSAKNAKFKILVLPKRQMEIRLTTANKQYVFPINSHNNRRLFSGKYKVDIVDPYGEDGYFICFVNGWPVDQRDFVEIRKGKKIRFKIIDARLVKDIGEVIFKGM